MKYTVISCTMVIAIILIGMQLGEINRVNKIIDHIDNIAEAVHYANNVTIDNENKDD